MPAAPSLLPLLLPQIRKVFQSCLNFVSGDLSSFYLDTAKDRLYIQAAGSTSRRACQTVQAAVLQVGGTGGGTNV
jgi:isoleucyl-tRNA synthetase